jgi:5'-methylthioadenosine phosphorylase
MIAFIGGTSLIDSTVFKSWSQQQVNTPYGTVSLKNDKNFLFLQRHGNPPLPPHQINHKANIWAMKHLGVQEIVAINSVGSLKFTIKPGTFLIPNDFLAIWHIPTFFDDEMRFMVPRMDSDYAVHLYQRCKAIKIPVKNGGIYVQTQGPRLETRAEINMLKRFGDVVGMTMASEVTLCLEYGIPYASICSIDNYCHGIAKTPLTMDEIKKNVARNLQHIELLIESIHRKDLQ